MKDYTDITFLLDRSGSMAPLQGDVIGGFNTFVREQKDTKNDIRLSLVQFDNEFEINYINKLISEVLPLNEGTYQPRGSTAYLDAIGRLINDTGARLKEIPESERPDKVVFVVQTDGLENASTKFTLEQIKGMIEHQQQKYNWQFVFFGANIDAVAVGGGIGIRNSINFAATPVGTQALYSGLSAKVASYSSGGCTSMDFTDDEKSEIEKHTS